MDIRGFLFSLIKPPAPSGSVNLPFQVDVNGPNTSVSVSAPILVGDTGAGGSAGLVPAPAAGDGAAKKWLKATGAWLAIVASDLAGAVFGASGASHSVGAVPDPGASAGTTKFLREDATWAVPAGAVTQSAIQQESYTYAADTGAANAYAVTLSPAPTLVAGSEVVFKAANANTGASTLAVNGGSATAIKKNGNSTALVSGDITAGQIVTVKYDGTVWQMTTGSSSSSGGGTSPVVRGVTTATAFSTSISVAIPTGSAAGDLAILYCCNTGAGNNSSDIPPTGWTSIQSGIGATSGSSYQGFIASKTLTSTDISAGSVSCVIQGPSFSPNSNAFAAMVTMVGAATVRECPFTLTTYPTTSTVTTSSAVQSGDLAILIGSTAATSSSPSNPTISPGTVLATANSTTNNALGIVGSSTLAAGAQSLSFGYSGGSSSNATTNCVVVIEGGSGPAGSVISVAATVPSRQSVTVTNPTTTASIAITDNTQSPNLVFAGPATGSAAAPTFRAVVAADLPVMVGDTGSGGTKGAVPAPGSGDAAAGKYLKADGTFAVPPGTGGASVMVASGTGHAAGLAPDPGATAGATKFLREDATWAVPAGGTGGSVPTAISSQPDWPPASPTTYDDEFTGSSLAGGWTWLNQGSATATLGSNSWVALTAPSNASGTVNVRGIYETLPSSPWQFDLKLSLIGIVGNYIETGIMLRQSSTGKVIIFGPGYRGSQEIDVTYWTSATAFSSVAFSGYLQSYTPMYFRVKDDGTNLIFSISRDGVGWVVVFTAGRTAFFSGSADGIGIAVYTEAVSGAGIQTLSCDFIRRTL